MTSSRCARDRSDVRKVLIFGAGGFARLAHVYLERDSPYRVVAFTVHEKYLRQSTLRGLDVVPFEGVEQVYPPEQYAMFVAIGYERANKARAGVYEACKRKGYELISYVSSKADVSDELEIGDNCFIFEGNQIQPFVRIGNDVIVGSGNHIGHDTVIEDHCFIAGHAMIPGFVRFGPYCFVGGNATFKDGITIAPECIIGAGSIILRDTRQAEVYIPESTRPVKVNSATLGALMHSPFFAGDSKE